MTNTKEYPFVSIIIPAKNEERNIAECLRSIQALDYPRNKIEILVIDNGSKDNTVSIAREMGAETFILPDATIAALRNYGFNKSRGDLIAFLDADCLPNPQWLNLSVDAMRTDNSVAAVRGIHALNGGRSAFWVEEYWINYLNSKYPADIQYINTVSSFCFVVKRKTIEAIGGFNENLVTCEDYDLGYRIVHSGGKIVVNRRIEVVHLGNAKTPIEFFRRQLWQGGSNLTIFRLHKFKLTELPNIIIPLTYLAAVIFLPFAVFFRTFIFFKGAMILFLIVLPAIITLKAKTGRERRRFLGYWYLWFLYFSARGLGILLRISHWKA